VVWRYPHIRHHIIILYGMIQRLISQSLFQFKRHKILPNRANALVSERQYALYCPFFASLGLKFIYKFKTSETAIKLI
jgi:hypothetical protein